MIFFYFLIWVSPFTADKVEIINLPGERVVKLAGNVIIDATPARIFCSEARVYEDRDLAILTGRVKIIDTASSVEADTAYHYLKGERSILKGNVTLFSGSRSIYAESLIYDRVKKFVQAFDSVKFVDTMQKFTSLGNRGSYDLKMGIGRLEDQPCAWIERKDKSPIYVWSRVFEYNAKKNWIVAYDSVRIVIDSIEVSGDSLRYEIDKKIGLIEKIRLTEANNSITGGSGRFALADENLSEFDVNQGQGVYITREGVKNEISGGLMRFKFNNGKAVAIEVYDRPRALLYLKK